MFVHAFLTFLKILSLVLSHHCTRGLNIISVKKSFTSFHRPAFLQARKVNKESHSASHIISRLSSSTESSSQEKQATPNIALKKEAVVRRYFEGVTNKDKDQILACFAPICNIRDVCRLREGNTKTEVKSATREQMADRCMEFVAAHPDCQVDFYYGCVNFILSIYL